MVGCVKANTEPKKIEEISRYGHLRITYYINEKGLKDGKYLSCYPDNSNTKCEECTYVNGKKEGLYVIRYPNGLIQIRCEYKNDKLHGIYDSFRINGRKWEVADYENGQLHGSYVSYYNKNVFPERVWEEQKFKNGIKDGVQKNFHENGKIESLTTYKDGMKEGKCLSFHKNGAKFEEYNRVNGEIDGKYLCWYDNGQKSCEYEFKNGNPHGPSLTWSLDTKEVTKQEYQNGVVVKTTNYRRSLDEHGRNYVLGTGTLIVWKACGKNGIGVYVKLEVPEHAQRITPTVTNTRLKYKSRVSEARVLEIVDRNGEQYKECDSFVYKDKTMKYVLGAIVKPDDFDSDESNECAKGLHVFAYKDHCDQCFTS
jgi:antitoxin component YwqK of YwqJK toxin-antitoxin module